MRRSRVEASGEGALLCIWGNMKGTAGLELGMSNDERQDQQWRPAEKELKLCRLVGSWAKR
jgi:hypothetical protein